MSGSISGNMSNGSPKENFGYVDDEITELPGTVIANGENGIKTESLSSKACLILLKWKYELTFYEIIFL